MKKITKTTLIFMVFLHFAGCSIVTNFQHYDIEEAWGKKEKRDDGVWVFVPFYATKSTKTIVPVFYDKEIYKNPYSCYFTIWGNFEEIQSVNATFILNGKKEINLPVDFNEMNSKRKKGEDGRFLFPAGKFELKIKWDEIEQLVLKTKFTASSKDGGTKEYITENKYIKKITYDIGNRVWFMMMSV